MPGTAVSIALVSPPLAWPGLGLKVSNWLGPPRIQSRMQAMPRLRSSSALHADQVGPVEAPAARLAAEMPREKVAPVNHAVAVHGHAGVMLVMDVHG